MEKTYETLRKELYPCVVVFVRKFIKGQLKGITHEDKHRCVDFESAKKFISAVQENAKKGLLDYKILSYCITDSTKQGKEIVWHFEDTQEIPIGQRHALTPHAQIAAVK